MKERIVGFVRLLRDAGIRISIAESIESCKALGILDITDRTQFKIALKTTLVKQQSDLNTFDRIFELYFAEPVDKQQNEEMSSDEFEKMMSDMSQEMQNEEFQELADKQDQAPSQNGPQDQSIDFGKSFDKQEEAKDLYKQGSESDLREKAKQLANSRKFEEWESEDVENTCDRIMIKNDMEYCKALAKNETRKSKHDEIEDKYDILKKFLKEEIEKAMVKQFGEEIITDLVDCENLLDKDLGQLTLDELERIQEIIRKLAKKLATHVSRKEKHAKSGTISIRRTIRKSIQFGTTSSELQFKNKKRTKSELVVLCDISGSVWMYVQFMLQLVIGIQNAFDRVESYIFVDNIKNVTEKILQSDNMQRTVNSFLRDNSLGYGTDYGNVFKQFSKEPDLFNKKTVLIIMGDAENTGDTIGADYLAQISDQCKAVYWLNPKDKQYWYDQYSEMGKYQEHCKEVYQCATLRHLEDFIKKLIRI